VEATVVKRVSFDAAHFLPNYVGKCHNMHGHHWVVELGVSGHIMEEHGFVVDFSRLKGWLNDYVVNQFDHSLLNDTIENPTAENIALHIKREFEETGYQVSGDVRLEFVRVWETEDSYAEVKG